MPARASMTAQRNRALPTDSIIPERSLTVRTPFVTEMVGEPGVWRLRKGDWRATFVIEGADVVVTRIGNRREIYR
jgi:mRNA-degrading endonuclease RelE of RelBE toxin-antitoxin system